MTFPLICYTMTRENKKTPLCFCVVPCELHVLQSPGPTREPLFSESRFSPPKVRLTCHLLVAAGHLAQQVFREGAAAPPPGSPVLTGFRAILTH